MVSRRLHADAIFARERWLFGQHTGSEYVGRTRIPWCTYHGAPYGAWNLCTCLSNRYVKELDYSEFIGALLLVIETGKTLVEEA